MPAAPAKLAALVDALPLLSGAALYAALTQSSTAHDELHGCGVTEAEPVMQAAAFLRNQAVQGGVTREKLTKRLTPLGFSAAHIDSLYKAVSVGDKQDTASGDEDPGTPPATAAASPQILETVVSGADPTTPGEQEEPAESVQRVSVAHVWEPDPDAAGGDNGSDNDTHEPASDDLAAELIADPSSSDSDESIDDSVEVSAESPPSAEAMETISSLDISSINTVCKCVLKHTLLKRVLDEDEIIALEELADEHGRASLTSLLSCVTSVLEQAGIAASNEAGERGEKTYEALVSSLTTRGLNSEQSAIFVSGSRRWESELRQNGAGHTDTSRKGWLEKQGVKNSQFQRRWFELSDSTLYYQKREGTRSKVSHISLSGGAVVELDSADAAALSFTITIPSRQYVLRASTKSDLISWYTACRYAAANGASANSDHSAAVGVIEEADASVATVSARIALIHRSSDAPDEVPDCIVRCTKCGFSIIGDAEQTSESPGFTSDGQLGYGRLIGWWSNAHITNVVDTTMSGQPACQLQATSRVGDNAVTVKLILGDEDQHKRVATSLRAHTGNQSPESSLCTDRFAVLSMVAAGAGLHLAYKVGILDKLGEGGARGVLGMKKWQERYFSLNEVWFTWFAKGATKDKTYDFSGEPRGTIRIADIDSAVASTIKGREHAFTISGSALPHSYSFATTTRAERDEWVACFHQVLSVEKLLQLGTKPERNVVRKLEQAVKKIESETGTPEQRKPELQEHEPEPEPEPEPEQQERDSREEAEPQPQPQPEQEQEQEQEQQEQQEQQQQNDATELPEGTPP